MEIEYSRDLYHSYMIIREPESGEGEPYCLRMLRAEGLKGILPLERRIIDNCVQYYYDITSKQSISVLSARTALTCDRVRSLFLALLDGIEKAYDYLLNENDFLLTPETIYMELTSEKLYLCYLPGYHRDIKEQLCCLMEYIMNKVDYNDKEAVLLVYNLYATGKEEGYTFNQLLSVINAQPPPIRKTRSSQVIVGQESAEDPLKINSTEERRNPRDRINSLRMRDKVPEAIENIPVMMEKVTSEREVSCYPLKTYLYTAGLVLGAVLVIIICLSTKILYNTLGNRIDYTKLFGLSLCLFSAGGYILMRLWDKKNRTTRIVDLQEYIDPRMEAGNNTKAPIWSRKERLSTERDKSKTPEAVQGAAAIIHREVFLGGNKASTAETGEDNPTCLLNSLKQYHCQLKPLEEEKYETIHIASLPFFIGKIRKNVDYCIEKDVVSRYHAKITKEQEQYYLTDLNSTNGTFLNREALPTYQPRKLQPGDEISFANIKYQFLVEE